MKKTYYDNSAKVSHTFTFLLQCGPKFLTEASDEVRDGHVLPIGNLLSYNFLVHAVIKIKVRTKNKEEYPSFF